MPRRTPRTPRTYDEIVRRTVIEPDSSFRPPPEQEHDALTGPYVRHDAEERAILGEVLDLARELGAAQLDIEVRRPRVTLRGRVPTMRLARQLVDRVEELDGVDEVVDLMFVEEPPPA